jgi:methylamine dehydrogenase accessory protein MauD
MRSSRTEKVVLVLVGVVILQLLTNLGLFLRMNQLQAQVLAALQPEQAGTGLPIGTVAPDFSLPDVDGREISLRGFSGQDVVLVFSSVTCPACQSMYPSLREFALRHGQTTFVMISRGTEDENRRLVEEEGFAFPILVWDDQVAHAYQVPGTPFFYVINGEGIVKNAGFAGSLEELEQLAVLDPDVQ